MSKVIMFGGGSGDQTGTAVPGVCTEACWDANNVSDLMGTNGEALVDKKLEIIYADPSFINPSLDEAIIVGDFSTGIAKWKENGFFQMSINTTPKCFVIGPTDRDFKTVEEAKKYYLEGLKICMEDTLYLLEDVEYRTYIKKGEIK